MSTVKMRHKILGMLAVASVITYIDRISIAAAAPRISADLSLSTSQMGYVLSAFVVSYALFEIPSGWLGDRYGPRRVLTRIVVWWSVFTSATGAAWNYTSLLICRFLFGAGEAGAFPNYSCAIGRWFPSHERGRAQSGVWTASRVGAAIAPLTVIPMQRALGWRLVFLIFGLIGLVWAIAWRIWSRDYPHEKAGITAQELEEIGAGSPRAHVSLPWSRAVRSGNLWALMLMYHTYVYASFWFFSWMPTYFARAKNVQALAAVAALPYIFGALANAAGGYSSDFMVRKLGLRWGRRSVGLFSLGSAGLLMLVGVAAANRAVSIVALSLSFGISDFTLPNCWAVCLDIGKKYAGTVSGAMNMAGQVGAAIATSAYGVAVGHWGWDPPLYVFGVLSLVSALFWFKIDPTRPLVNETQPEREELANRGAFPLTQSLE